MLTHPTTPVLAAVLAAGERQKITGAEFLLAYIVGVEVECRIADSIDPRHYQSGFHSTATIGGLGAVMAVGKILRLKGKCFSSGSRYLRQHGLRTTRELRHHDQAASLRPRG